jgi:hypothetical protein
MATTTNYSWTTPDDTALVKDGAAAIRTLGSSADTTVKALNPGTTAGDIDYYTTSTTKARVAIGTAGQVLQVNSGATAPEWATASSGMTLIATTTYNDTASTYTYSSLGSYKHLFISAQGLQTGIAGLDSVGIRFNADTGSNYNWANYGNNVSASEVSSGLNDTNILMFRRSMPGDAGSDTWGQGTAWIPDYAGSGYKSLTSGAFSKPSTGVRAFTCQATWNNTAAITSITIFVTGANNFKAGVLKLYGVS